MSAAARLVRSLAFSGAVALCSTPALAADGGIRLPDVDFTVAHVPYVPSVTVVLPPALITDAADVVTGAEPAPLAEAAQLRPVDLPRTRPAGVDLSTSLRRSMYVSFAALQVMDVVSTRQALNNGATEANPAMAGLARNSTAFFAVKAGTAAATTYFAERLARKHPRRATILMAVLNTAYAAIVVHNYRVAGSSR
jgi:hypothetical protein